jgi:hypothetical protein
MATRGFGKLMAAAAFLAVAPAQAQPEGIEAVQAARAAVEQLSWLSGTWEAVHEQLEGAPPSWTEEIWTEPRGAMMLGIGRRGQGVRLGSWELLRIQGDGSGQLALYAQVEGEAAIAFPLVRSGGGEAVFENAAHDYPQRIAYRREGDRLTAEISRIDGSDARSWEFRRRTGDRPLAIGR